MWWAREQDYTALIGSDLPLLVSDTRTLPHVDETAGMWACVISVDNHVLILTTVRYIWAYHEVRYGFSLLFYLLVTITF